MVVPVFFLVLLLVVVVARVVALLDEVSRVMFDWSPGIHIILATRTRYL